MSIGTSVGLGLAVAGGLGAVGSVATSLIGSSAAKDAAKTQADAADQAAALQKQEFDVQQQNLAPWLAAGQVGLGQLMSGTGPNGNLLTPFSGTFIPPTEADAQATPGYQFTLDQGNKAILNAQTASGGAFTGGTAKSLEAFNSGLADSTYSNRFNQALQTFQTQFNSYNTNQSNQFNRLASIAGIGQTATGQLNQAAQNYATTAGNDLTSAGAATAAGQVGSANAINSGITGVVNNLGSAITLRSLLGGSLVPGPSGNTLANTSTNYNAGLNTIGFDNIPGYPGGI